MIFVDSARIFVKAGDGGKGCESFYSDKFTRYPRPDGGDGGKGGDVVFVANKGIQTLLDYRFKQHYQAKAGGHASSKGKKGKTGEDCLLRVPVGTIIRDEKTGLLIKDLTADEQSVVVVKGGLGGRGNARKPAGRQAGQTPAPPGPGEERTLLLELKLIADVGLVGFPNAGKSTLISGISKVKSKVANYPFTTKQPILGMVEAEEFDGSPGASAAPAINLERRRSARTSTPLSTRFVVADLPGLIEGAHEGRGLGDRFLKHAERTKILLHVIDMAGSEGRDPLDDYEKINSELQSYSDELFFKHKIVAANKMDLEDSDAHLKRFKRKYKQEKIFPISALKKKGLAQLVCFMNELLCQESTTEKSKE